MGGVIQSVRELVVPAAIWVRKGEVILRVLGEAEELLTKHLNEAVDVSILGRDEEEKITFKAALRRFMSNGHHYVVVFFPKRLTPMIPAIEQLKDSNGRVWLLIRLLGVRKPTRKREGGGGV